MELQKPTHVLVKEPEMGVRYLADYMGGSERKKRAVMTAAKYRSLARMIQHREAKAAITTGFVNGSISKEYLLDRSNYVRQKLASDDFDAMTNEANADYLKRFAQVIGEMDLLGVQFLAGKTYALGQVNGLKVPFATNLTLRRMGKGNKLKVGAMMYRYAKGKPVSQEVAEYQSAAILGFLKMCSIEDGAELDPALCITLDGHTGHCYAAPSKSVTMFKNTLAACETIADAWPNVKPPPKCILK